MNLKIVTTECKLVQPVRKIVRQFLRELKIRAAIWFNNPTPRYISRKNEYSNSKRYMHPRIHSSTIYNSQDMETTQVAIKMWHNEILLNDKKEWNNAIYSNMDGPREYNRRRQWHPTPVLVPGNSHGRRSLVGCSPWGRTESDITERLHFHFSLSCTGEGNGNPLQCSCLENSRDGGSWWAAVYGVAQSRTRLKRLSSSSSREYYA